VANENDKDLGIILSFFIDEDKETGDINAAIKRIEEKINKLNIKINIDNETLKSIEDSLRSINQIGNENFKKLSQLTEQATQASREHEKQLQKEAKSVQELSKNIDELSRKTTIRSGSGKVSEIRETRGDQFKYTTTTYRPQEDGSIITTRIEEVLDQGKLNEAKKKYENFVRDFTNRFTQIEKVFGSTNEKVADLANSFAKLNERSSKADFSRVNAQLRELEQRAKEVQQYEQWWQKALRDRDLKEQQALERQYQRRLKQEQEYERWWLKALHDREQRETRHYEDFLNKRKKAELEIADLRRRFGADPNVTKGLNELENRLQSIAFTPEYKRAFQDFNYELKQIKANASTATSYILGFSEAIRTAFIKFPVWLFSGTVIMQTMRFFQYGLQYTTELDSKLNEIAIVLGKNQEEVRGLAEEYNNLAKEMSVTTREIAEASVEFYRQGLTQDEVMKRLQITTQYAKISSLEFKDAAEILTATVNSMGVDIERASDVFAYLGDATATGKFWIFCRPVA
jgi:hypothetical protein